MKFDWKKNKIQIGLGVIIIGSIVYALWTMFSGIGFYGVNVTKATGGIRNAALLIIIAVLAYSIYRIVKRGNTRKILYSFSVLVLVVLIPINVIIPPTSVAINRFIGVKNYDKQTGDALKEEARALTQRIEEEGLVMLENKNQSLPLSVSKVNIFGYASNNFVYGGTGSGGGKEDNNISLVDALESSGFEVNKDLVSFYEERFVPREAVDIHKLVGGDYNIHEPAQSEYTDTLMNDAKNFSDTALVVFARNSGEGADMAADMANYVNGTAGQHYLQLSQNEKELLERVKGDFENVVVILNATNQMELGFLEEDGIDAALWIGYPGSTGFLGLANVLNGTVSPSGRLVDTYAYDLLSNPSYFNTGEFPYTNSDFEYGKNTWHHKYIDYAEGIYMGYRYYETRFVNNETGVIDEDAYQKTVQYPFGYGLSYTNFEQTIANYTDDKGMINIDVKVKNTGDVAGKEVVQVYFTAPYTMGGIEKSHVVLADFGKTKVLKPGEEETVSLSFKIEDMASYDEKNAKAYVLEQGNYEVKLMGNAHDVIDSKVHSVPETIVYGKDNSRSSDEINVTNQFDDIKGDVVYLSRADWEGTFPKGMAQAKEASEELLNRLNTAEYTIDENAEAIVHKKNGLTLKDMKGLDYDDPQWDLLLEQLSINDMKLLITSGGFQTAALDSVKKPATIDTDGPAGVNDIFAGLAGNQYTSEVVLASTWNQQLAYEMGNMMAKEGRAMDMTGLYMPGINLHRSTLGGRNFEYYSEDPIISARISGNAIQGVADEGLYAYVKHFAMYDMETKRYEYPTGATVWSNEQAMREVYLRAFEVAIKDYDVTGVMSSYNRLGPVWVGASEPLMQTVLREEWGFDGVVISDFYKPQYMDGDAGLAAGNDLILYPMTTKLTDATLKTNWGHQNMRRASHNILYAVTNSDAYDMMKTSIPSWIYLYVGINVVGISLASLGLMKSTNGIKKQKRNKKA